MQFLGFYYIQSIIINVTEIWAKAGMPFLHWEVKVASDFEKGH